MRYEEPTYKIFSIIFIIIAFLMIFSPWFLSLRELIGKEGLFGIMAMDMKLLNPTSLVHGENLAFYYPLYPWIVSIFYKLGFGIEISLRGTSILAVGGMTVLVFEVTRRVSGFQGAFVASAFMFSNIFVLEKANDGSPFTLAVLLLFLGWFFWYYFGIIKKDWNIAWIIGFLFAGLAFYTLGWMAILYFFIPLIFMRRPLTLWNKLNFPGFTIGICIVIIFILFWIIPQLIGKITIQIDTFSIFNDISSSYLKELFLYPFNVFGGFLPWSILAWPVFCVAYYPLDDNPIFSRFLRIIFFSLFFVLWVNPFTSSRDLIILVPPVAIITGNYYWLLIRRNGFGLRKIFLGFTVLLFLLDVFGIIMYLVPDYFWTDVFPFVQIRSYFFFKGIDFFKHLLWFGIAVLSVGILVGLILLVFHRKKISLWIRGLGLALMFMVYFWTIMNPHDAQGQEARDTAEKIIKSLGSQYNHNLIIYKGPHIADIYILSCYLKCKINKILNYNKLPHNAKNVFVFTLSPPVFPDREWNIIASPTYKGKKLYLWKGTLIK